MTLGHRVDLLNRRLRVRELSQRFGLAVAQYGEGQQRLVPGLSGKRQECEADGNEKCAAQMPQAGGVVVV